MIARIKRLWALSALSPATMEDVGAILLQLDAIEAKSDKIIEWMSVLLKAELARHETLEIIPPPRRSLR